MITKEVAVIGAGIIGLSIGYYLAKEGFDVVVIEREAPGSGSSGACDGFLLVQTKKEGPHQELALKSLELYKNLSEELESDIEFKKCGSFLLAENERDLSFLKKISPSERSEIKYQFLEKRSLKQLLPLVSSHLAGGRFSPYDAQVNPLKVVFAFLHAFQQEGGKIQRGEVKKIKKVKQGYYLSTEDKDFFAEKVVNAAGFHSARIAEMVGLGIPIIPCQGEIIVTEPLPSQVNSLLLEVNYIRMKYPRKEGLKETKTSINLSFTLEQTQSGNFLIGSTREWFEKSGRTSLKAIKAIANRALNFLPNLKDVHIIRTFAGVRPATPDGLPILGWYEKEPNFIFATGHGGDGISLAPITGKLIAESLKRGRLSPELEPFKPERFN